MGYVVFEDPEQPLATTDTLSGAFADVQLRAGRQAVWGRGLTGEVTLQFRYLSGQNRGELVGAEFGEPETMAAPATGGQEYARRLIMTEVMKNGVCGFYACNADDFHRAAEGAL